MSNSNPSQDQVEKRIAELRSVEGWLSLNLNMVRFSIQGLELQKSALNAMHACAGACAPAPTRRTPPTPCFGRGP